MKIFQAYFALLLCLGLSQVAAQDDDSFGDFSPDPFEAPAVDAVEKSTQPATPSELDRIKVEELAIRKKLEKLTLEKKVRALEEELARSGRRRVELSDQFADLVKRSNKRLDNARKQSDDRLNELMTDVDRLNVRLKERSEKLYSQHHLINAQTLILRKFLKAKLSSKQPAEAIEALDELMKLKNIGEEQLLPFKEVIARMTRSEDSNIRGSAIDVIGALFPQAAIELGYQASTEYWLPCEAVNLKNGASHVRAVLATRRTLDYDEIPLEEIPWFFREVLQFEITFDSAVDVEQYVDFEAKEVVLGDALEIILGKLDLAYSIKGTVLMVTPKGKEEMATLTYRIDALVEDRTAEDLIELSEKVLGENQPGRITAVNANCLVVVADEIRQRKFSAFLAKLNAAR